jgi:uncharacterized protein YjlB
MPPPPPSITPLNGLKVLSHQVPAHGLTPNTSLQHKPLLIYRSVFPPSTVNASVIEKHLHSAGVVVPQWRYTMYSTSHFHSTTHEVLGIARGKAKLCFGHEENEGRVEVTVESGDVVVVPAGVAHRLLEDLEGGFEMVSPLFPFLAHIPSWWGFLDDGLMLSVSGGILPQGLPVGYVLRQTGRGGEG